MHVGLSFSHTLGYEEDRSGLRRGDDGDIFVFITITKLGKQVQLAKN